MIRSLLRRVLGRAPGTAQFIRSARELMDRRAPSRRTPWGFTLAGDDAMASGAFEPEETRLVRELLGEVDVFVNVGANIGYYCCHALSLGRPVVAFEPNQRNLHYLLRNVRENGWSAEAEVFPVALGARSDVLEMWGSGTGASLVRGWASIPESWSTLVPVQTLDRMLGDRLAGRRALIVVDIEGAELAMLRGAARVLRNDPRAIWLVEITTSEHQPAGTTINPNLAETFGTLFDAGYRARSVESRGVEIDAARVSEAAAGRADLGGHNFVFRAG